MKTTTNTISPAFALFALACLALSPQAWAVCQEGCLSNANTVLGEDALLNNTTGFNNTANGFEALLTNTTGTLNTASGYQALFANTTGPSNTAIGYQALLNNTVGSNNTAIGVSALHENTTSSVNTAIGALALLNTTGGGNTAVGYAALVGNTTGSANIALGTSAGTNLTTGNNNIDIGNEGIAGDFQTIRIGAKSTHKHTFIAGISGSTVPDGVGVMVSTNGKLGTVVSSARFKDDVRAMGQASEAILALQPVTFRYKRELDPSGIPQFGLVAEEVEKVNPDLVARDDKGKPYTVRYEAVNAMLLNEFLKEHRQVQEQGRKLESQDRKIREQEATVARQQKQIESLTLGLQKVTAQLELSKTAPQSVVSNP
jgi:Chaperone of endosialidase